MEKEKNYLPIYDKVLSNLPRIFGYGDIFNSDIMVVCAIIATLKKRNSAFISLTYTELIQLTGLNQHTVKRSLSKIRKDYMDISLRRTTGDNHSWCIWIELTQGKTYDVYLDIVNNYKPKFVISKKILNSNLTVNEKIILGYIHDYTQHNHDFYLNGKTVVSELRMSEIGLAKIYKKLEHLGLISSSTKLPRKKGLVQKIYRKANSKNITEYYKNYAEYIQKIENVNKVNKVNKVEAINNVENNSNIENNSNVENIENNKNIENNSNVENIENVETINTSNVENITINVYALGLSEKFIKSLSKEQLDLSEKFINSLSKEQLNELFSSVKQNYDNLHNIL